MSLFPCARTMFHPNPWRKCITSFLLCVLLYLNMFCPCPVHLKCHLWQFLIVYALVPFAAFVPVPALCI